MGVYRFDDFVIKPSEYPWGVSEMIIPAKVFFNHRFSSLTAYDSALISLLEGDGHEVDFADTVPDITFEDYDILMIGAPDDDWVANHPQEARIQDAQCHVISFCRGVSRNALALGGASGSQVVTGFTLVNSHDHFTTQGGGNIDCGPSLSTHRLSDLGSGVSLVYHNGEAGFAGFAYRKPQEDQYYIHFGYHGIDQATDELKELLLNTTAYLEGVF